MRTEAVGGKAEYLHWFFSKGRSDEETFQRCNAGSGISHDADLRYSSSR